MPHTIILLLFCLCVILAWPDAAGGDDEDPKAAVSKVLDTLHDAASKADGARYFGLFTEDAVFLGTDASERWTITAFKAFAKPYFDKGKGWTYTKKERNVDVDAKAGYAWFDELLDNESYGVCRGSGVLRKTGSTWRIVQYNLTIPIPNALAKEFAARIREEDAK